MITCIIYKTKTTQCHSSFGLNFLAHLCEPRVNENIFGTRKCFQYGKRNILEVKEKYFIVS